MNNVMRMPMSKVEQAAEALTHLNQMNEELLTANETIAQLQQELQREQDRAAYLDRQVERVTADGLIYRDLLVQLATQMTSIGEMTTVAKSITAKVMELTSKRVSEEEPPQSA